MKNLLFKLQTNLWMNGLIRHFHRYGNLTEEQEKEIRRGVDDEFRINYLRPLRRFSVAKYLV